MSEASVQLAAALRGQQKPPDPDLDPEEEDQEDYQDDEEDSWQSAMDELESEDSPDEEQVGEEDSTPEDPLAGITFEQIRAHPELSKALQSHADTVAAAQLRGRTEAIRRQVESEVYNRAQLETLKKFVFDPLPQDQLAEVLASDPDLAKLYGAVQNLPTREQQAATQSGVDAQALIESAVMAIRTQQARINSAEELTPEVKAKLDPKNYLTSGAGQEGYEKWVADIDKAIVDAKVAASLPTKAKAKQLQDDADADSRTPARGRLSRGSSSAPRQDVTEGSAMDNLQAALARQGTTKRRRL